MALSVTRNSMTTYINGAAVENDKIGYATGDYFGFATHSVSAHWRSSALSALGRIPPAISASRAAQRSAAAAEQHRTRRPNRAPAPAVFDHADRLCIPRRRPA